MIVPGSLEAHEAESAAIILALGVTQPKIPSCAQAISNAARWNSGKIGGGAVFQDEAFEATVISLAQGCMDTDFRGDAGEDQLRDAAAAQDGFEVSRVESPLPRLVDDRLAGARAAARG